MRLIQFFLTLLFFTVFSSCDPLVTFTEPQPPNIKNLTHFPKRLQGEFLSLLDNSILRISEHLIERTYDYDCIEDASQMDSVKDINGKMILYLDTIHKKDLRKQGDSVIWHVHYIDSVFEFSDECILRKFKGYYFLSFNRKDGSWEVSNMKLSKGKLTIGNITTQEQLQKLQEITEDNSDTVAPHTFSPTKKQFRKFVKSDGFGKDEVFVRMKK